MNRFQMYVAAATLACLGTGSFAADPVDMSSPNSAAGQLDRSADRAGDRLQQIGNTQADEATSREARMSLARLVNDALTPNHFDSVTKTLAQSDQDRMSKSNNINADDLNRIISQFRADFRAKYGQEFDTKADSFSDVLVYGAQDKKSVTISLNDTPSAHSTMIHSDSSMSSANMNAGHDQNLAGGINRDASDNTLTDRAASDRKLNTSDTTLSNRNGAASASDTSSSTLGNRTGPASSGNNSNSVVRGNDTTANPGIAVNPVPADSSHMTTSADVSRSAVGSTPPPAPAMATNNMTTGTTGATADRALNTTGNDVTQSNRNGALSASDTSSSTLGNRTGPASSGNNANSVVRGNDTTANPGITSTPANTVPRQDMVMNTTTPPSGSAVALHFTNEGGAMSAWRLDVADQLSAQQLKDNLAKHIQMLDDQKSTWPTDVNAAYKATAFHVLQAFNDTNPRLRSLIELQPLSGNSKSLR